MESTTIPPDKTAGEISSLLIAAGARQIACDYDAGRVTALRWVMRVNGHDTLFQMPARVEPVYEVLKKRKTMTPQQQIREQAERVAWRQLLRWVQAQLAMIETGMVQPAEVFFAYIDNGEGRTLFEHAMETRFKLLSAPEKAH